MQPTNEQLDLVSEITERNVFTQCIDGIWHYGQIHIDPQWFVAEGTHQTELSLVDHVRYVPIARSITKEVYLSLIPAEHYHRYLFEVAND